MPSEHAIERRPCSRQLLLPHSRASGLSGRASLPSRAPQASPGQGSPVRRSTPARLNVLPERLLSAEQAQQLCRPCRVAGRDACRVCRRGARARGCSPPWEACSDRPALAWASPSGCSSASACRTGPSRRHGPARAGSCRLSSPAALQRRSTPWSGTQRPALALQRQEPARATLRAWLRAQQHTGEGLAAGVHAC